MKEGDVVLTPIPQADGALKDRPALLLRELPPFGDFLVCGISTQVHQAVPDFDEIIRRTDADFAESGVINDSLIRLAFLGVIPRKRIAGSIGAVSQARHERLLVRLSKHLVGLSESIQAQQCCPTGWQRARRSIEFLAKLDRHLQEVSRVEETFEDETTIFLNVER